jgi:succinate dehydrogenase/fumarate reductase flavoprotein subunit
MAIIYSRAGGTNLQNVQSLFETADSVKQFYMDQVTYNCNQVTANIDEVDEQNFSIFPNPSTGSITIQSANDYTLTINDLNGRLIQTIPLQTMETSLELKLNQGVYLFEFQTKTGRATRRVVITN